MPDNNESQGTMESAGGQAERTPPLSQVEQVNSFFDTDWSKDPDIMGSPEPTALPETPSGEEGDDPQNDPEDQQENDDPDPESPEDDQEPEDEETPSTLHEFAELLDLQIKRHDEVKSVKEWLSENPDLKTELLGQVFDYANSKREVKEYLAKEKQSIEQAQADMDMLVIQNLALESGMPFKTYEDFESDNRVEDPAEAFREYKEKLQMYAQTYQENVAYAQMENKRMIDSFTQKYPEEDVSKIIQELAQYVNPATSKSQLPFPKDALEVYYKGKHFDKVLQKEVAKAVEAERKKIYAEIKANGRTTGTSGVPTTKKQSFTQPQARSKSEQDFLDAFTI